MGKYYVTFDGTSAFVVGEEEIGYDEVLFSSHDLDECQDYADEVNEEAQGIC